MLRKKTNHLIAFTVLLQIAPVAAQPSTEESTNAPAGVDRDEERDSPDKKVVEEQQAPPKPKPLPGPKYNNLRFKDDFSYLTGEPGTYREDFFDPIKFIEVDENWRFTFGGEFRFRLEAETNKGFGANKRTQDTFQLYRFLLHADVHYRDVARVFVQGINAFDEDRDLALRGIDENRWDLHQLFFDVRILGPNVPLTLRVGRQELQYGNQRLVSPLDWANVRRRFDAVKLIWQKDTWRFDAWYARPVVVERKGGDDCNEDVDFYGAYFSYTGWPRHGLDVYGFAIHDETKPTNPNARRGNEHRYTLGTRFWGATGPWDYEAEVAGQWGKWGGDTVQAWSTTLDGGYNFRQAAWQPRLGAGFDWASGDRDPNDGSVQTFDQLFPLGHKYLGYLDLIGRQNITALNVNLSAWPVEQKVHARLAYHVFWLSAPEDALYNAGGGILRRDSSGNSERRVGHELDVTVNVKLDVHSSVLLGYSHMWAGEFISDTGPREDPDLFYVQYRYRF